MKKDVKKTTIKKEKKKVKINVKKLVFMVLAIIICVLGLVIIFRNTIFKEKVLGETFKLVDLKEYRDNVKESKIERIAILSQTTNFETEEKEDIKKILEFIDTIEGSVDKSEVTSLVSNSYGIVLYYKDNTNTVITISPNKFAVADSEYYNNRYAYYTTLKKLLEELK